MTPNKTNVTSNDPYLIEEYKECFGKNCKNYAVRNLKIKYINKIGHFCQRCTDDLIQLELAEKIEE